MVSIGVSIVAVLSGCGQEESIRSRSDIPDREGPVLELHPEHHRFGELCDGEQLDVTLSNVGLQALDVAKVDYLVDGAGLVLEPLATPLTLEPGATTVATIHRRPLVGEVEGLLTVYSTDPRGPRTATQVSDLSTLSRRETHPGPAVDVLVVVDTSESSFHWLESGEIAAAVETFAQDLSDAALDWQAAAIWGAHGCVRGTGVVRSTDPNAAHALAANLPQPGQIPQFSSVENDDGLWSRTESALDVSLEGCNLGLRRPGAALSVLLLNTSSFREFASPGVFRTWSDTEPHWLGWVDRCWDLTVHATASQEFHPYLESAEATGGVAHPYEGNHLDWNDILASVAARTLTKETGVRLDHVPVPGTLEVTVDGEPVTDFEWDWETNQIRFESALSLENQVEVAYLVDQCTEPTCSLSASGAKP